MAAQLVRGNFLSCEMMLKPITRKTGHLIQRAMFFKEVGGSGDNHQALFTLELRECLEDLERI